MVEGSPRNDHPFSDLKPSIPSITGLPSFICGPTRLLISIALFSAPDYELRTRLTSGLKLGVGAMSSIRASKGNRVGTVSKEEKGLETRRKAWPPEKELLLAKTGPHISHEHGAGFLQ